MKASPYIHTLPPSLFRPLENITQLPLNAALSGGGGGVVDVLKGQFANTCQTPRRWSLRTAFPSNHMTVVEFDSGASSDCEYTGCKRSFVVEVIAQGHTSWRNKQP